MMSLHEKNVKLPEEQFGIELTDEEVSKAAGGENMSDYKCHNEFTKFDFENWRTQYGICEMCPLYYEEGRASLGRVIYHCGILWTRIGSPREEK